MASTLSAATLDLTIVNPSRLVVLERISDGTAQREPLESSFALPLSVVSRDMGCPRVETHVLRIFPRLTQPDGSLTLHGTFGHDESVPMTATALTADFPQTFQVTSNDPESGYISFSITLSEEYLQTYRPFVCFRLGPEISGDPASTSVVRIVILRDPGIQINDLGKTPGTDDYWFQLRRIVLNPLFQDGQPPPEDGILVWEPFEGQPLSFDGPEDIRVTPEQGLTDSEGMVGVVATVDPFAFYAGAGSSTRSPTRAVNFKLLKMAIRYRDILEKNKDIRGNFCEVIQLKGHATFGFQGQDRFSVLKQGAILRPGTIVDMATNAGEKATIILRFVDGKRLAATADVQTNSCYTQRFEIGTDSIIDRSDIGLNWFGISKIAVSLCEQFAGLPNTPGEAATAMGKFVVKEGLSNVLVPGSGAARWIIRYSVKTATGNQLDKLIEHRGGSGQAFLTGAPVQRGTQPPQRDEISLYYDGSTRLATTGGRFEVSNLDGSGLISSPSGTWTEVDPEGEVGRAFTGDPNTLDGEGPDIQVAYTIVNGFPNLGTVEVDAVDPAELDGASLLADVNGSDITSVFSMTGEGRWEAAGLAPAFLSDVVTVSLADRLGNAATAVWSNGTAPPGVVLTSVTAAGIAGQTSVAWSLPAGADEGDIFYYQVRQEGREGATWKEPWLSVGLANMADIQISDQATTLQPYRVEVRAVGRNGLIGPATASENLSIGPPGVQAYLDHLLGIREFTLFERALSDANGDGAIDIADLYQRAFDSASSGARPTAQ